MASKYHGGTVAMRGTQSGMGMAGIIVVVLFVGALLTVGGQVVPVYLDHNTMANILDGMSEENGLGTKPDSEINKMIKQRFKMNNVRDFNVDEHVVINRTSNGVEVVMDYEVRMNMVKNLDLIAAFDKKVELRN